jgi:hypothetical protein
MCFCRCTEFFDTAVAEYGKGRTFVESSGRSHVSEGKETREEGGHQTINMTLVTTLWGDWFFDSEIALIWGECDAWA